ncbi:MAG: metal-sulfur cluster assembly factor [Anaerolineae bacterium]
MTETRRQGDKETRGEDQGKESPCHPLSLSPPHLRSPARLWRALEDVKDPEFPMSVVDMGLIYEIEWQGTTVYIDLTFTAMGCPAMDFIIEDIRERLLQEEGVEAVEIEIVWDPPWTKERLSEKGRALLQHWGVAV